MKLEQGKLLIAQPFLNDGWFKRSVILITEHNEHGTMGFVLNRFANLTLKDVLPGQIQSKLPLFYGGPVGQNQMFYIHTLGKKIKESLPINSKYFWGGDFTELVSLLNEDEKKLSKNIRFFIGYAGWEPGQLDKELEQNAWFVNDPDSFSYLQSESADIWGRELKRLGTNWSVLANFPEDPSLN
jgi:putative transcriptional regulator